MYSVPRLMSTTRRPSCAARSSWSMRAGVQWNDAISLLVPLPFRLPADHPRRIRARQDLADHRAGRRFLRGEAGEEGVEPCGRDGEEQSPGSLGVGGEEALPLG